MLLTLAINQANSTEGPKIREALEDLQAPSIEEDASLASKLGCPVYQQTIAYGAHFLSEHPCFVGALPHDQRQTSKILGAYDLLIVLGSDPVRMSVYSEHEPLPAGIAIVQIGLVDHDIAKNFPAEIALKADVRETWPTSFDHLVGAGQQHWRNFQAECFRGPDVDNQFEPR